MTGCGGAMARTYPRGTAPYKYRNTGRILTFKLGAGPVPLPPATAPLAVSESPPLQADEPQLEKGKQLFASYCLGCHGGLGETRSVYPSLDRMLAATHEAFQQIVHNGTFPYGGMASFADVLTEEDVEAIHTYLISEQHKLKQGEERQKLQNNSH